MTQKGQAPSIYLNLHILCGDMERRTVPPTDPSPVKANPVCHPSCSLRHPILRGVTDTETPADTRTADHFGTQLREFLRWETQFFWCGPSQRCGPRLSFGNLRKFLWIKSASSKGWTSTTNKVQFVIGLPTPTPHLRNKQVKHNPNLATLPVHKRRYSPRLTDFHLPTNPWHRLVQRNCPEGRPSSSGLCLHRSRQAAKREMVGDKGNLNQHSSQRLRFDVGDEQSCYQMCQKDAVFLFFF